jgi:hypothetical protein
MASHFMKGLTFFRDAKPVDPAVPNLMDLPAKGVADLVFKASINPGRWLHGLSVLLYVFNPFTADQRTDSHNSARERSACLSLSGHTSGQGTARFKDFSASHI